MLRIQMKCEEMVVRVLGVLGWGLISPLVQADGLVGVAWDLSTRQAAQNE